MTDQDEDDRMVVASSESPTSVVTTDEGHRLAAAVDLIRFTGADGFQLRSSGQPSEDAWRDDGNYERGDPVPVVWTAVVERGPEAAAGLGPALAVQRLAAILVDGSTCIRCGRLAGVWDGGEGAVPSPLDYVVCWWSYDSEHKCFQRDCRGGNG